MGFSVHAYRAATLSAVFMLSSCGGGGGGGGSTPAPSTPTTFTVGGSVTGLVGTGLVLRNNGADDKLISTNGAFAFNTALATGAVYSVTVAAQPANQTCAVAAGAGNIASANVTSVSINCTTITFTLGGSVSGLTGTGLVLQNNGADNRSITANGQFTFASAVNSGSNYAVTVLTHPTGQVCTVSNATGTALANTTTVLVGCTNQTFTVSGTVTGLAGSGYTIQNNFGDDMTIAADGPFSFTTSLTTGESYNVSQVLPPATPLQSCTISNGSGTINGANVSNVNIACETHKTRFAFTTNSTDGTVQTFAIDDANGQWNPRTIVKTTAGSSGIFGERTRRHLYIRGTNAITGVDIEANTAVLTEKPSSPYATGASPVVYVHPNGTFIYATSATTNNLTAYSIEATTGRLNAIPGSPYPAPAPVSIAFDPRGLFMYRLLPTGVIKIDSVNATTGELTEVGQTILSGSPQSIVMYKSGRFLYTVNSTAGQGIVGYSVHPTTGALSALPGFPFTAFTAPTLNGVHPSGRFFYFRDSAINLANVVVNPSTGGLGLAPSGFHHVGSSLNTITHPSGRFHYGINAVSGIHVFSINTDTGAEAQITGSPVAVAGALTGYFDPSGKYFYVATTSGTRVLSYSVNQATGALTPLPGQPSANIGRGTNGWLVSAFTNGLTFHSDYAYSANAGDQSVSAFAINNATGAMTSIGAVANGGQTPKRVVIDLRGRFVYAINTGSNSISTFQVGAGGALTLIGTPLALGTSPTSMTIDPSGRFAYVACQGVNDELREFEIDQTTGVLTPFSTNPLTLSSGSLPHALAVHPNGLFVYSVNRGNNIVLVLAVDQNTGALSGTGGAGFISTQTAPNSIAIDPSGRFAYVANGTSNTVSLYGINAASGALTALSTPTVATAPGPQAIAIDRNGKFVFVGSSVTSAISVYSINPTTGVLTAVSNSPFATAAVPTGLKVDYSGKYLHVSNAAANQVQTYSINATTGALAAIASGVVPAGLQPDDLTISTRTD